MIFLSCSRISVSTFLVSSKFARASPGLRFQQPSSFPPYSLPLSTFRRLPLDLAPSWSLRSAFIGTIKFAQAIITADIAFWCDWQVHSCVLMSLTIITGMHGCSFFQGQSFFCFVHLFPSVLSNTEVPRLVVRSYFLLVADLYEKTPL